MKFTPLNEEQAKAAMILPDGAYPFKIIDAEERRSKAGKDMIKVTLSVSAPTGGERRVTDYLLEAMRFKLLHLVAVAGLGDKYKTGELAAQDFLGVTGQVQIETEEQPGYPAKNVVKDYVVAKDGSGNIRTTVHESAPVDDSQPPF